MVKQPTKFVTILRRAFVMLLISFAAVFLMIQVGYYVVVRIVLVPLALFAFIGVVLRWVVNNTSSAVQGVVLVSFFLLIASMASEFIAKERVTKIMSKSDDDDILGQWYPILFPIYFMAMAVPYFSGLSCVLKEADLVTIIPDFPVQDKCIERFASYYFWHFLDSIPLIELPQTIRWAAPFDYKDTLSGVVLLLFKLMVILPSIQAFVVWRKFKQKKEEKDKANPTNQ